MGRCSRRCSHSKSLQEEQTSYFSISLHPCGFSSRHAESAGSGGGDLPRRAADEEVQAESGVWSSAVLRHLLSGLPPRAAAVRHQVRQHPRGWAHRVVQRVSAVIGTSEYIEESFRAESSDTDDHSKTPGL